MKILTIPSIFGGKSHTIPLYVLHQRYLRRLPNVSNHFLIGKSDHDDFRKLGLNVMDIDYTLSVGSEGFVYHKEELLNRLFEIENLACEALRPDLIIEDNSFSSIIIAEKYKLPRISIHRTGFFRSLSQGERNNNHVHSLLKGQNSYITEDVRNPLAAQQTAETNSDIYFLDTYLKADVKLIPGIPAIEVLPENIDVPNSYYYCGPLTVEDKPSIALSQEIDDFLKKNNNRKKVFITTGLVDKTTVADYIQYLFEKGYAVITTARQYIDQKYKPMYFENSFLPLNYICEVSDLIIHQCGSGMYHYPIMNIKPSITLGTQCYDREDVAIRLQQLNISKHVPHPADNDQHMEIFISYIDQFEHNLLHDAETLFRIKDEIIQTILDFDMEQILTSKFGYQNHINHD